MSEQSMVDLVAKANVAWQKRRHLQKAIEALDDTLTELHEEFFSYAVEHIDERKLRQGPLSDLPMGELCLLKTGGGPMDWAVVVMVKSGSAPGPVVYDIEGEVEFRTGDVLGITQTHPRLYRWARLGGDDQVFSNPKFRRNQA